MSKPIRSKQARAERKKVKVLADKVYQDYVCKPHKPLGSNLDSNPYGLKSTY